MLRSLARFSGPESLVHTRSLADFITTTSGCRFSVHTPGLIGFYLGSFLVAVEAGIPVVPIVISGPAPMLNHGTRARAATRTLVSPAKLQRSVYGTKQT